MAAIFADQPLFHDGTKFNVPTPAIGNNQKSSLQADFFYVK